MLFLSLNSMYRAICGNSSALLELSFERPLCVEVYKDCKELGRFMLRTNGVTIAAGMISEVGVCGFMFLEALKRGGLKNRRRN